LKKIEKSYYEKFLEETFQGNKNIANNPLKTIDALIITKEIFKRLEEIEIRMVDIQIMLQNKGEIKND
jgi:hypothetical protein